MYTGNLLYYYSIPKKNEVKFFYFFVSQWQWQHTLLHGCHVCMCTSRFKRFYTYVRVIMIYTELFTILVTLQRTMCSGVCMYMYVPHIHAYMCTWYAYSTAKATVNGINILICSITSCANTITPLMTKSSLPRLNSTTLPRQSASIHTYMYHVYYIHVHTCMYVVHVRS